MAELIRDHIALGGIELYCDQTGIRGDDFIPIEPCDFAGHIFAVDGSNRPICGWSVGSVNLIRAGYAVY
ncbi:MAG: hypothetical protein QUS08_00025, partial [Methanothrix sp.]|nr:hypothetical protein [Methanothrix sp.]